MSQKFAILSFYIRNASKNFSLQEIKIESFCIKNMKKYNKIVFYGDSITRGTYTDEGDNMPASIAIPSFPELVAKKLQAESFKNNGKNGISFSSASCVQPEIAFCNTINESELGDAVFIAFGTNDYGTDVPIGNIDDKEGNTFFGAVNYCLNNLKIRSPQSDIFVILPLPRLNQEKPNKAGFKLDDYRNALKQTATKYGAIVIDGGKVPINPSNKTDKHNYIFDGTHINEEGHKLFARFIIDAIA